MVKVGIVGATGYTGSELVRLLLGHPKVEITALVSRSESGQAIGDVLPHLRGAELPLLSPFEPDSLSRVCDLLFLAGENGFAMQHAPAWLEQGMKLIDLSADFRLKDAQTFEAWYSIPHRCPDYLSEALYGLVELTETSRYEKARLIANPGCYPTATGLALAPLAQAGWIAPQGVIVVDAKSGVSGAGRSKATTDYLFSELNDNFKAYNVLKHRHTPEIEQNLQSLLGEPTRIRFTPHLIPMTRGILSTVYAPLKTPVSSDELHSLYDDYYAGRPFVQTRAPGDFPATRHVYGSNRCDIGVGVDERTGMAIIISVIDNLMKGAAGQAIQNMNCLYGWEETLGLPITAVAP